MALRQSLQNLAEVTGDLGVAFCGWFEQEGPSSTSLEIHAQGAFLLAHENFVFLTSLSDGRIDVMCREAKHIQRSGTTT